MHLACFAKVDRAEKKLSASLAEYKQASERHAAATSGGGIDSKLGKAFNEKKAAVAAVAREVSGMVGFDAALLEQARAVAATPDAKVLPVWDGDRKGSRTAVKEGGLKAEKVSGGGSWHGAAVVGSCGWSRGTHSWCVEAYTPQLECGCFCLSVVGVTTDKLTGSELEGDSSYNVSGKTFGHSLYGGSQCYSLGKASGSDYRVRKKQVTLRLTLDCDAHTLEVVDDDGQSIKIKLPAGETFFPYAIQAVQGSWVKFVA